MQCFLAEKSAYRLRWILLLLLVMAYYFYFFIFNRFHLYYLEQTQLFRYSNDALQGFVTKPGEVVFYLGEFLSQFFVNPIAGAGIVTFLAASTCFLTHLILKKIRINGLLWSLIPGLILAALQSDHLFKIGLSVGLVMTLLFVYGYLQLHNHLYRFLLGAAGWLLLYLLAGGFALLASLLVILFELFHFQFRFKWVALIAIVLLSALLPYIGWRFFFLVPFRDAWCYPFPLWGVTRLPLLIVLLAYFPLLIGLLMLYKGIRKKQAVEAPWNYATLLAGSLVVLGGCALIYSTCYKPKIEVFFGMDRAVQKQDWNKVIELSKSYEGPNQLVTYYTNLALYKTGQLSNHLFDFPQTGLHGLYLEWTRDEVTPFFGGEVFYHLNYINEAYRWAFESMVVKGFNPRSLKRLVITSLINGHYEIAAKYLDLLDQTLFYKDWAARYRVFVNDPGKINSDNELAYKRKLGIKHDFISHNLGLTELLEQNPQNKMAFEYQMSMFLLDKDITSFSANIYRLKELGYHEIPVNYEEALLFCMTYFKKDLVPEGFSIRAATLQRKEQYIAAIAKCGGNRELMVSQLKKQFGNTCWYYLHFVEKT